MDISNTMRRSCGTCRDRRISCDRAVPACSKCLRAGRTCKGYGIRLSWPTKGDARRALVLKDAVRKSKAVYIPEGRRVHVSFLDVELHNHLVASSEHRHPLPTLYIPMPFDNILVTDKEKELFQYFQDVAFQSLAIFDRDPKELCNVLMRIALSESNTSSSTAVLHSLLALSSLHRYGVQSQAIELKISGINALAKASRSDRIVIGEAIQHIAAGMLLCSFEIQRASCTSSQWTCYISGVKDVLENASLTYSSLDGDLSSLLDWVYYHDVLGRFALLYWRRDASDLPPSWEPCWVEVDAQGWCFWSYWVQKHRMKQRETPKPTVLDLLSDVSDAVAWGNLGTMTPDEFDDYKNYLQILDFRLRGLPLLAPPSSAPTDSPLFTELYQLAVLVYLHRASPNVFGASARTQHYIHRAFTLFAELPYCSRQFPIFILGAEARTDEERAIMLDFMDRTEKNVSSRSLNHTRILLNSVWAQDDLAQNDWGKKSEIGYWEKLTGVISACSLAPSLV